MDHAVDEQVEQLARAIAAQPNATELYYELAEAHWRAGDLAGYAAFFRKAYLSKAHLPTIPKPIFGSAHKSSQVRDRASALAGQGVAYTDVISALARAEARLGNRAAVECLMDYERFLHVGTIEPPDAAPIEAFNRTLADEIKSKLRFYEAPPGRGIRHAWRYNWIERAKTPALRQLMQVLRRCVADYRRDLPKDAAHPFTTMRPAEYEIAGWAVVSNGSSHHQPHIHPRAWATGVYYVVQPDVSKSPGAGRRGWLTVGPPAGAGDAANPAWERRDIEPVPGRLVLMPGYFWHETKPMEVDQERICVAFEVYSTELRTGGGQDVSY